MKAIRIIAWLVMLFGGAIGGLTMDKHLFPALYGNILFHLLCIPVGLALLYVVMTISRNTGRSLAKYGREGNLPRLETNRLATKGIYAHMRHPMHLGLLFFPFAIAFLVGSPSFIIIISPFEALFMLLLIKLVEEPEAKRKFGTAYDEYMKNTPAFCFKPECIRMLFKKVEKK